MSEGNKKNNREFILNARVRAYQQMMPESVEFRSKERILSEEDKQAIGRAIWFVVKKGWGCSTSVQRVTGSFDNVPTGVIEKGLRQTFPEGFFVQLAKAKNKQVAKDMFDISLDRV